MDHHGPQTFSLPFLFPSPCWFVSCGRVQEHEMGLGQVILDWCFDPSNLPLVLVGIVLVGMLFVRLARKAGVKSNAVNWAAPLPSETGANRTVTELWIYPVKVCCFSVCLCALCVLSLLSIMSVCVCVSVCLCVSWLRCV